MVLEKLSRPWLTLGVRLSVFPIDPWEVPPDLWHRVVGQRPETDQAPRGQRLHIQTGPWLAGSLQLAVSPFSVVWQATSPASEEGLPNLENWLVETVIPEFVAVTNPWLASVDLNIKRLGFGLHSVLPAADQISSYKILQELVRAVAIEPETTSDFFYQINRPIPSRVLGDGTRFNRLTKWSVPMFQPVTVQVTPVPQMSPATRVLYASLDNDVNTPGERLVPLEKGQLEAIYDELVQLAWENLEFGEKP
jgi:hypothetical protein